MNAGGANTDKALKALVSRKTTVAQYLSSSSSLPASQVQMTQSYCSYPHRTCMRSKLEGFDYCIRHILEDRNAPYRQCSYVSSRTGHKCSEAALRTEKRERFVLWHFEDLDYCRAVLNLACTLLCWLWHEGHPSCRNWVVRYWCVCLERGANYLHMVQLMPLPPHHLLLQ